MIEVTLTTPDEKRDMIKHIEDSIDMLEHEIFEYEKENALSGLTRKKLLGKLTPYDEWYLEYGPNKSDISFLQTMRKKAMLALKYNETLTFDTHQVKRLMIEDYKG